MENPYAFKNNRRLLTKDFKIKMKTELCSSWVETQTCKYGDNCAFAHGEDEIRKKVHVPSMYKTKLCQQFHESGVCAYGVRCQFIHSQNLGEVLQKQQEELKPDFDLKKMLSYSQMLSDNAMCIKERVVSSSNPYLNEFNLIYKDVNMRLPVFEQITSEHHIEHELPSVKLMKQN